MNWQPIETAPKDGSTVLLYGKHPYGSVRAARWDNRPKYRWVFVDDDTQKRERIADTSGWHILQMGWDDIVESNDIDDGIGRHPDFEPTHWMDVERIPAP